MREHGVAAVERQPEVLAAPTGTFDATTGKGGGEVVGTSEVPAYGARVRYRNISNPAPGETTLEAPPDHLDLRQFGHCRSAGCRRGRGASRDRTPGCFGGLLLGFLLAASFASAVHNAGDPRDGAEPFRVVGTALGDD